MLEVMNRQRAAAERGAGRAGTPAPAVAAARGALRGGRVERARRRRSASVQRGLDFERSVGAFTGGRRGRGAAFRRAQDMRQHSRALARRCARRARHAPASAPPRLARRSSARTPLAHLPGAADRRSSFTSAHGEQGGFVVLAQRQAARPWRQQHEADARARSAEGGAATEAFVCVVNASVSVTALEAPAELGAATCSARPVSQDHVELSGEVALARYHSVQAHSDVELTFRPRRCGPPRRL